MAVTKDGNAVLTSGLAQLLEKLDESKDPGTIEALAQYFLATIERGLQAIELTPTDRAVIMKFAIKRLDPERAKRDEEAAAAEVART